MLGVSQSLRNCFNQLGRRQGIDTPFPEVELGRGRLQRTAWNAGASLMFQMFTHLKSVARPRSNSSAPSDTAHTDSKLCHRLLLVVVQQSRPFSASFVLEWKMLVVGDVFTATLLTFWFMRITAGSTTITTTIIFVIIIITIVIIITSILITTIIINTIVTILLSLLLSILLVFTKLVSRSVSGRASSWTRGGAGHMYTHCHRKFTSNPGV